MSLFEQVMIRFDGPVIAIRTERKTFHGPFALVGFVWTFVLFRLHRTLPSG